MIIKRRYFLAGLIFLFTNMVQPCAAQSGKSGVGQLKVSLFFGTNGDPAHAGDRASLVSKVVRDQFSQSNHLKFNHYRLLGEDVQPILRSYENWAAPLKPSEEILLSFQPRGNAGTDSIHLDLELWQSKKKIMKAGHVLYRAKPIFIMGPEWRGGRIIISVVLTELKK